MDRLLHIVDHTNHCVIVWINKSLHALAVLIGNICTREIGSHIGIVVGERLTS